ncbi:MAG: NifB/NifX family molybdenum-iron cluster-binding protein [candidate division WOR-3 bacterium]
MKVAVATDGDTVAPHFGRCEKLTLVEIENGRTGPKSVIPHPGHCHGALARILTENRVEAVICGGIGPGALDQLTAAGIAVYPGVSGTVEEVIRRFAAGTLVPGAPGCGHEGCGNHHSHRHGCQTG